MLDYNEVKKFYAEKLAEDFDGTGRIESAFYHTMKMVYLKGVEDGGTPNEAVAKVNKNNSGQIYLTNPNGDYFEMSKYLGKELFIVKIDDKKDKNNL